MVACKEIYDVVYVPFGLPGPLAYWSCLAGGHSPDAGGEMSPDDLRERILEEARALLAKSTDPEFILFPKPPRATEQTSKPSLRSGATRCRRRSSVRMPPAFRAGMALLSLGGVFALWGQSTMRRAGTNVKPTLPATALVTGGLFQHSRNPLYVALTLLYLGLTLAVNTLWGFVALIPLLVVMQYGVIMREERYLETKFGDAYRRLSLACQALDVGPLERPRCRIR